MKMKISNYIAGKLVEEGISQAFMVTGGGAMHLDDGLGHQEGSQQMSNVSTGLSLPEKRK